MVVQYAAQRVNLCKLFNCIEIYNDAHIPHSNQAICIFNGENKMKSIQIKGLQFIFVAFCLVLATGLSACNGGAPSTSSGVSSENNPL